MAGTGPFGSSEIAGALVNPKGLSKKVTATVAGSVAGGVAGRMAVNAVTGSPEAGAADVPNFGRVGYLTVSTDEIALARTQTGMLKMKVTDEALARAPRSEITNVNWDARQMLSHLRITFASGSIWEFDVPKASKKAAESVVAALGR